MGHINIYLYYENNTSSFLVFMTDWRMDVQGSWRAVFSHHAEAQAWILLLLVLWLDWQT